jgi:hypothetical protein
MNWLKKNDKIVSYITGLLGLGFAFYAYFFPIDRQGKLTYFLSDSTNVFAVNKPIDELTVLIGNRNIIVDSLDLKIFKFRLINNGSKNILPSFYDQNTPFGLQILEGKIISVKISGFNSEYLKDNILSYYDSTALILNKVIFERKEYVDFELLITHKNYRIPQFVSLGKISSIKKIPITNQVGKEKESFFKGIQKSLLPMGISIIGILFLMIVIFIINNLSEKRRYNKLLNRYKMQHAEIPDIIFGLSKLYSKYGKTTFISIAEILLDSEKLQNEHNLINQLNEQIALMRDLKATGKIDFEKITFRPDLPNFIEHLKQYNGIIEETNAIKISDELREELILVLKYLR